ncbi:MAG: sensor histidine kinase [Chloroflexi bacterium]|nr:sensor histidine kinase [Chloroflexota bacterium]
MPGGLGWFYGARPGMPVLSVNGRSVTAGDIDAAPRGPVVQIEMMGSGGNILRMEMTYPAMSRSPMKFSLWAIGAMFALLGSAVVLRRPDLAAARMFWVFAGFVAVALAVGPSAGGPAPYWARILQGISLIGIGQSFLPFVSAITRGPTDSRHPSLTFMFAGVGLFLGASYGVSLLATPSLYAVVRPAVLLFVSASVLGGFTVLLVEAVRRRSALGQIQARLLLWGTALSIVPFAGLSLMPKVLGRSSLLPDHITVLALGVMPASFAYAILQHQLLGIRRLVHRGMVYGVATLALLVLLAISMVVIEPLAGRAGRSGNLRLLNVAILVGGIALFLPLRRGAWWLVDNLIYRDVVDYQTALETVHRNILVSDRTIMVGETIAKQLAQVLRLESAIVLPGTGDGARQPIAKAGPRADDVLQRLSPQLEASARAPDSRGVIDLRWESDSFLLVNLELSGRCLGRILLGPKEGGEVFLAEEKGFVATLSPLLALAIDKSQLAEELRALNQRLVRAAEDERARMAGDIHDGPLQKAMALMLDLPKGAEGRASMARQLASELREICSRLRPAVLDDLGLAAALEWLLEGVSRQSSMVTRLSLHDVDEDERFPADTELALFRVTQEATNNAMKHSHGTRIDVSLSRQARRVGIEVRDDGVGFSPDFDSKEGFGLSGMRERIVQVNGSFEIRSAPGVGTTVVAAVPLP